MIWVQKEDYKCGDVIQEQSISPHEHCMGCDSDTGFCMIQDVTMWGMPESNLPDLNKLIVTKLVTFLFLLQHLLIVHSLLDLIHMQIKRF